MMKTFIGICLLGLVGFVTLCYISPRFFIKTSYTLVKSEFTDLPEFSAQSLQALSADERTNYIVVDVRTPEERDISIIVDAVDQAYFETNLEAYQKNKIIIVYCTIGYRSGYYAQELRQKGFDAYNLSEGILGWIDTNGLLVNPHGQETLRVHVYSRPWNLAVKNHIAIF